jgi:amino acid transporter
MATATAAKPEVFVRKASGLVRVMSPFSAFVYNILTMGIIFPWTYLWAPATLPGGQLVWGILLAMVIEIPIAVVYVFLSTALPRSGGDYVFQSRVFGGGTAFTVVMSGYVIWILQWVALSGWLLAALGFSPLFLGLGAALNNPGMIQTGLWFISEDGIVITSIINALLSMVLLVSGFKNYVRFQWVIFYATLLAFGSVLVILFTASPATAIPAVDKFAAAITGNAGFYETAKASAIAAKINLNPAFSLMATILVAPIAWTSLQWATYSAQQNGEIKDARSVKNQMFIIVGSLIATGVLLALLAVALEKAVGTEFLYVAGSGYWWGVTDATISGVWLWPNIIAVAISQNPLLIILIGIGFILNSFQIVCNCYIGMTRVMVAMSLDRLLPEWISKVSERFHTPVNAHIAYFLASIPVIWLYNKWDPAWSSGNSWASITLGVTFACGYVFVISCLAGALLPYRAKEIYEASPAAKYKVGNMPLITVLGILGFILGGAFVVMFIFSPELGLNTDLARIVVAVVLVAAVVWYFIVKYAQKSRGIDVGFAYKEIPPE